MHLYVKHATLINNCYPEKEGESGSRSSELSYLTFYASSRPVKLTKVGLFLEKKVERDVAKGRKQHNIVSLEILRSLIQACHRDLNLFSKYIVKILSLVLDTKDKDIQLIDLASETFVVFCTYHDGTTLGVDAEFTSDYEALIKKFAGFCTFKNNDDTLTSQMEYIGHRGLQACVVSPALQASNYKTQLGIVMPPIIVTLAKSKQPVNDLVKSKKIPDLKQSALDNNLIGENMAALFAAKTVALLFEKSNGAGVRLALSPLMGYMDAKQKWWPPNFAVASLELVLNSLQPQYRYLLVSEILQQFESTKSQSIVGKQASLVSVLDTVLNANLPLVGISVLEVLNSLFGHLIKSLQGGRQFREQEPNGSDDEQATFEYAIHQGLAHSIAGLTSHTYYQNQLDDITGYLLAKLRVGTTLEQVEGLSLAQYRHVTLKCLDLIASNDKDISADNSDASSSDTSSNHDSDQLISSYSGATISLETWVPAFGLLVDTQAHTRIEFAMTLVRYLNANADDDLNVGSFPKHTLNQHGDVMFINSLQQSIAQWAILDDFGVQDVQALYHLLCALTRRFGADGTIKTMPLVFQLQTLVKQGNVGQTSRQRALAAVVVEYLDMVGQFYHVDRLVHYVNQVRSERLQNKEYSTVEFASTTTKKGSVSSFDHLEPENTTPVDAFLDRHVVVEILSKDAPLRDEDDTHGLDLESKLYVEWGSEAFVNQERSFRIRTSRNLDEVKPKLATPWISTDFTQTQEGKKQTIKVENLKEALTAMTSGNEENEANGAVDGLHILTSSSLAKRTKDTRPDVTSLLSGLSVGTTQSSSLVNPPYTS
ncbi:hypothetical protein BCR42DRAFT_406264 [Absidia repens]|uniref:Protein EFR3 n=1 Tax=Absidia repens TaxID=90262 RepID=A0A1X2IUK7_9FUNG|nr:hypothetical protein BCR42DRAFT_406264 [Absidia repens]